MPKYRKKPVIIEAMQLTPTTVRDVQAFTGCAASFWIDDDNVGGYVDTDSGSAEVGLNDWIIKGIKGEFYPCKPDIFEATYEVVEDKCQL